MDTRRRASEKPAAGASFAVIRSMTRWCIAAILGLLAACDASPPQLRQVTIESPEALGLSLREVPQPALRAMGLPYGLTVVRAGLLAERSGLRIGDVVYGVNQKRLRTIEEEMAEIERVTMEDVRRVLDRFPYTDRHVLLTYGPLNAQAFGVEAENESQEAEANESEGV
jgi:hypothetical protein